MPSAAMIMKKLDRLELQWRQWQPRSSGWESLGRIQQLQQQSLTLGVDPLCGQVYHILHAASHRMQVFLSLIGMCPSIPSSHVLLGLYLQWRPRQYPDWGFPLSLHFL